METARLGPPLPRDAVPYTQGYLDQRRQLQTNRSTPYEDALRYYCAYHLGRIMTSIDAGNEQTLAPVFRHGLAD